MARRVKRLAILGLTDAQIAVAFGVTQPTLIAWKTRHPEFSKQLSLGREAPERAAAALAKRAVGFTKKTEKILAHNLLGYVRVETREYYPPDVKAALAVLKQYERGVWSDGEKKDDDTKPVADADILELLGEITAKAAAPAEPGTGEATE